MHFSHRNAKTDGVKFAGLNHNTHVDGRLLPTFSGTIDVPAAVHQHVRNQSASPGEMNEYPFATRFDVFDGLPPQRRVVIETCQPGKGGTKGRHSLPAQCAIECARRAKDGIAFGHGLLKFLGNHVVGNDRQRDAAQVKTEWSGMEAGIPEEARDGMSAHRLAVNGSNQDAFMTIAVHAVLSAGTEKMGETGGDLGALGLLTGKENQQARIIDLKSVVWGDRG